MDTPADGDLLSGMACPIPISDYPAVLMAHGGGGKLGHDLVTRIFISQFGTPELRAEHDGAILPLSHSRIAFTTDSYVVNPIVFPGGTIGDLAVNGTVNDLAMCGAVPIALSAAFIIEEGLPMDELWRVVVSMQRAAGIARVGIVTGDTKVVDKGKGDKVFITTSGIGVVPPGVSIAPVRASAGDVIILSGSIAEHGVSILSVREGLEFSTDLTSDTAPLASLVSCMLDAFPDIHVLRDPTRGGLATVLNEVAKSSGTGIVIDELSIPVKDAVRGACEILGLDPLYVANEGRLVAFVPRDGAEAVLHAMRDHEHGRGATAIGTVVSEHSGVVVMKTRIGGRRVVDMLSGEQLPRIC